MRKLQLLKYEEYKLIADCKYQTMFPSMNGGDPYVCCTRNLEPDKRKKFLLEYINIKCCCNSCDGERRG